MAIIIGLHTITTVNLRHRSYTICLCSTSPFHPLLQLCISAFQHLFLHTSVSFHLFTFQLASGCNHSYERKAHYFLKSRREWPGISRIEKGMRVSGKGKATFLIECSCFSSVLMLCAVSWVTTLNSVNS